MNVWIRHIIPWCEMRRIKRKMKNIKRYSLSTGLDGRRCYMIRSKNGEYVRWNELKNYLKEDAPEEIVQADRRYQCDHKGSPPTTGGIICPKCGTPT